MSERHTSSQQTQDFKLKFERRQEIVGFR
jgi:hypothetical protein